MSLLGANPMPFYPLMLKKLCSRTRNLCLGTLIETICDQTSIVDLEHVNRAPIQPD